MSESKEKLPPFDYSKVEKTMTESERFVLEERFLYRLADVFTSGDISPVAGLIAKRFVYDVIPQASRPIKNRDVFFLYLHDVIERMKERKNKFNSVMMYRRDTKKPHLMFSPKCAPDGSFGVFSADLNNAGKVKELRLCPSSILDLEYKSRDDFKRFLKNLK